MSAAGSNQRKRVAVQTVQEFEAATDKGYGRLRSFLEFLEVEARREHTLPAPHDYGFCLCLGAVQPGIDVIEEAVTNRVGLAVINAQESSVSIQFVFHSV